MEKSLLKEKFETILGNSSQINSLKEKLENLFPLDVPVLFLGEKGVGKDFFVSILADKDFIKLHSEDLQSELQLLAIKKSSKLNFKKELIEIQKPVYFDRIELLSEESQAVLFRILEKKEIVVKSGEILQFNSRMFFSSDPRILDLLKNGNFRKDLFLKLSLVKLEIPNLKDRKEDIPFLVNYFIEKFKNKYKKRVQKLSDKLIKFFQSYDFPNNIQELSNLIESIILLSNSTTLDINHIPENYLKYSASLNENKFKIIPGIELQDYEKEIIKQNLKFVQNNRQKAAKNLGISLRTLYRKIKEYNLD